MRTLRGAALVASAATIMLLAACRGPAVSTAPPTATPTTTSPSTAPVTALPPTTHPPTVGPTTSCSNQIVLATWTTARLAEQTVVIPVGEDQVASITAEVRAGAGGVILFGSQAPADLAASLARLSAAAPDGIAPFIMTDEEGGAVQRMANLVGVMPSARTMAATMTPAQIQQLALTVGRKMKAAGVTMDLAPVLDLDGGPGPSDTNPDGTRSFSPVESTAENAGLAFADGLRAAGVIPVVKHFPGLGGATGNTDSMAASTLPWSTLRTNGLLPFAAAVRSGIPAVMVANATVPGLTGVPASLSSTVITGVLRRQLGFSGLVITDSLSATAIHAAGYSVPGASVQALRAGADLVLYNATPTTVASLTQQVVAAIVAAVGAGNLSRSRLENAVLHIMSAKHINLCRP